MSQQSSQSAYMPEGWDEATPRIVVTEAQKLVEFIKHVFDGKGDYRTDRPSVISIGASRIMISEAGARDPNPSFLYVYVEDADETYRRALKSGAKSLEEPSHVPYGDRRATVVDQWGNT